MTARVLIVGDVQLFKSLHAELFLLLQTLDVEMICEEHQGDFFEIKPRQEVPDSVILNPSSFRNENRKLLAERKKLWQHGLYRASQKSRSSKMKVSKK